VELITRSSCGGALTSEVSRASHEQQVKLLIMRHPLIGPRRRRSALPLVVQEADSPPPANLDLSRQNSTSSDQVPIRAQPYPSIDFGYKHPGEIGAPPEDFTDRTDAYFVSQAAASEIRGRHP
jgi:hypothetical protein